MGPKSNNWCPDEKSMRDIATEGSQASEEAEMGVIQLQAKEHYTVPTTKSQERARKDSSLEPSEGS